MKRTTATIALLAATNLVTAAYLVIAQLSSEPDEIYVDHLEDLRLNTASGNLQAQLGDGRKGSSAKLVFTPHGVLQFHSELGRMFALIEKKAAEVPRDQPAKPESPRPSL